MLENDKKKDRRGSTLFFVHEDSGKLLLIPADEVWDSYGVSSAELGKTMLNLFDKINFECYLAFWIVKGESQVAMRATPEQIRKMLLPHLLINTELAESLLEVAHEAARIYKDAGEHITEH